MSIRAHPRLNLVTRLQNKVLSLSPVQLLPKDVPIPVSVGIKEEFLAVWCPARRNVVSAFLCETSRSSQHPILTDFRYVEVTLKTRFDHH